jgi:hypothetical protein
MYVGAPFASDFETSILVEPSVGSFNNPAMLA